MALKCLSDHLRPWSGQGDCGPWNPAVRRGLAALSNNFTITYDQNLKFFLEMALPLGGNMCKGANISSLHEEMSRESQKWGNNLKGLSISEIQEF